MLNTVNLYIFACIHFREFAKNGNFALIYVRVFDVIVTYGLIIVVFMIFADIWESRIMQKYVRCQVFYIHSISIVLL